MPHAQPYCVATREFHNKVSIVPENTSPEVTVRQKFEIQIQIFDRFICNCFYHTGSEYPGIEKRASFGEQLRAE